MKGTGFLKFLIIVNGFLISSGWSMGLGSTYEVGEGENDDLPSIFAVLPSLPRNYETPPPSPAEEIEEMIERIDVLEIHDPFSLRDDFSLVYKEKKIRKGQTNVPYSFQKSKVRKPEKMRNYFDYIFSRITLEFHTSYSNTLCNYPGTFSYSTCIFLNGNNFVERRESS